MEEELSSSSYFHLDHSSIIQSHEENEPIYTYYQPSQHQQQRQHRQDHDDQEYEPHRTNQDLELQNRNLKIQRKRLQKERLSKMTKESTLKAERRLLLRNTSIRKIQLIWRKYKEFQRKKNLSHLRIYRWIKYWIHRRQLERLNGHALLIQKSWRAHKLYQEQKISRKFSQHGRWDSHTSHQIFGLLLGYLVRRRIRKSSVISKARRSLRDAWTVLEGLLGDATSNHKLTVDQLIFVHTHNPQAMTNFKAVDWPFARMFIKEVLSCRGIIWEQMIGSRLWSPLPRPGYYYYPSQQSIQKSRPRKMPLVDSSRVKEFESASANSQTFLEKEKRPSNPQSLADLLKAKGKDPKPRNHFDKPDMGIDTIEIQKVKERDLSYLQRPATAPSHTNPQQPTLTISPMISTPKRRKTNSLKPHLQIDVISADKLAPVKGKPIGGATDRKPGFRIHLFLPSKYTPGGDLDHNLSSMKLSQTINYDSNVETLFPVWNQIVYLNLPIPPSVEQNESLSESLLNDYWSLGYVKIEIVDGERFHEDIFLGEACLLLSSLLSDCQRRDQVPLNSNVKSMGGTLPLCKRNPTDRVTGTVNAIGYLHLPLPDHLESNVRPNPSFSTPARKSSGEKTTPDVNSSSVNRLTPLSSSKKIPRSPTPPSHDLRVTHASSTPPSNGRSSSERRRRKNTPPMARHSSHDSGYDEISHITPKYSGRSDSPTYSGYSQQVLSINQTPNRPATAPDRKNRIAEQLNKLESLASTLQIDAESAVNKLNRKLQDRIEEKNEIPFVNSNQDSTDMVHPDTDKEIDQPPSRNRKIALNPKNLSNQSIAENKRSQLEDADVLLANLRRRLNEKKIAK